MEEVARGSLEMRKLTTQTWEVDVAACCLAKTRISGTTSPGT